MRETLEMAEYRLEYGYFRKNAIGNEAAKPMTALLGSSCCAPPGGKGKKFLTDVSYIFKVHVYKTVFIWSHYLIPLISRSAQRD
jgi:hypothetical protein